MGVPESALMSMPACQPRCRRPNPEAIGPSTGHVKPMASPLNSGIATKRRVGTRRGPTGASRRPSSSWIARAVAGAGALFGDFRGPVHPGIDSRWPTFRVSPWRWLAARSADRVTLYCDARRPRESPRRTTCTQLWSDDEAGLAPVVFDLAGGGDFAGAPL